LKWKSLETKLTAWTTIVLLAASLLNSISPVSPSHANSSLSQNVENYLSNKTGSYSVTAIELGGSGREFQLNGDREVDPASIFKLYYAQLALEKVQEGSWTLQTRLGSKYMLSTCLKMMLSYSDNDCASDIRKKLGSNYVNARLSALGFDDSRILLDSRGNYVSKLTSTNDVANFLASLENGELLNPTYTSILRNHLKAQIWRARISSALQAGTQVVSKSGQLLTDAGMIEADSAIVYGPSSTYVLVVIGTGDATAAAVKGVSDLVYREWQGPILRPSNYPSAHLVTNAKTYLRSTPGGRIIKTIYSNTAVTVQWSARGWVYVKVGTRKGYLYHSKMKLSSRYLRWGTP
jgi:beta-lactamase class A